MRTRLLISVLAALWVSSAAWVAPAQASEAEAEGDWLDLTLYCGQGVCVPFGVHHRANVRVEFYRIGPDQRIVFWQRFGGSVYPSASLCGVYDWRRGSTEYLTASGALAIRGWTSQATWCGIFATCRAYFSAWRYGLRCEGCRGRFQSYTWFTNRCWPNTSGHVLQVVF